MNLHQTDEFLRAKRLFDENQFHAARSLLSRLADEGDCQSQYMYGFCLLFSDARIADAIDWLRKAATQGSIDAYRMLGTIYDPGVRFAGREDDQSLKDVSQAAELYQLGLQVARQLAEQGDAYAQYCLGSSLWLLDPLGLRGTRNFSEGLRWLELAATNGNPMAAWLIALEYLAGRELPRDVELAKTWYRLARKNGVPFCALNKEDVKLLDEDLFQ